MRELVTIHNCFCHWCLFFKLFQFSFFRCFLEDSLWFFFVRSQFHIEILLFVPFASFFAFLDLKIFIFFLWFLASWFAIRINKNNRVLILLSMFILVKDLTRWLCLLCSTAPTILHGADQCSVLWELKTSFPSSMETYMCLMKMISTVMLGNAVTIWYTLGLSILLLI